MVPLPFLTPLQQTSEICMSPLLFLAIPLVIFLVGSSVLYFGSRYYGGGAIRASKAPADLQMVAPMLKEQRESGWPVSSDRYSRR